jgi:hypothetical protein
MPPKKRRTRRPKLITDPKTGLRITQSPEGTKVTNEDVRYERLKRRQRKMSRQATEAFWNEERGERAENPTLRASPMPDGSLVIQGMLPDGKYLVLEVRGKKVKVAFFGAPAEPPW